MIFPLASFLWGATHLGFVVETREQNVKLVRLLEWTGRSMRSWDVEVLPDCSNVVQRASVLPEPIVGPDGIVFL